MNTDPDATAATTDSPPFLCRYRSFQGEHRLYLERLLLHNEIFLTSSTKINDPFDCRVELSFDATDDERRIRFQAMSRRVDCTEAQRSAIVDRLMSHFDPVQAEAEL